MTTIKGEKITLRPYRLSDAEAILRGASDPVARRLTGTHATFTLEQTQNYVARYETAEDRVGFIIAHPATLEPLGEIVLLGIDEDNRNAGLRIAIFNQEDFSKGYGSEAIRLVVNHGFKELNLHRISLEVFDFNPRAIHVYEKVGFKREGVMRDALFYDGEYHNTIMMGILESEWQVF
jgi:RimJ/RimL family protein N-acetyltransferase